MKHIALLSATALVWANSVSVTVAADGQAVITDTFCNAVQVAIMGNTIPAETMVHPDYEAFVLYKASVDPLRN